MKRRHPRIDTHFDTRPNVLFAIDTNAFLSQYARPGGWNDPDMLIGSSSSAAFYLTPIQSRSQFSMWAVMAAPLILGCAVQNLSAWDLETYSNAEVLAVNQDVLGQQGVRLAGGNLSLTYHNSTPSVTNVWGKKLSNGSWAVLFLNNGNAKAEVGCSSSCLKGMSFQHSDVLLLRDLWAHTWNGTIAAANFSVYVEGGGGSVLVQVWKANSSRLLDTVDSTY